MYPRTGGRLQRVQWSGVCTIGLVLINCVMRNPTPSPSLPSQGCAHGTLMLSTTVLLFQPHCGDPLVKEEGKEAFELAVPIQDISYAALTRECRPPGR